MAKVRIGNSNQASAKTRLRDERSSSCVSHGIENLKHCNMNYKTEHNYAPSTSTCSRLMAKVRIGNSNQASAKTRLRDERSSSCVSHVLGNWPRCFEGMQCINALGDKRKKKTEVQRFDALFFDTIEEDHP